MIIKNMQMVGFLNGFDSLVSKKLPTRLGYALVVNQQTFVNQFVDAYQKKQRELEEQGDTEEIRELLNAEINVNIQTVPLSVLEKIDDTDRYDTLTPIDYANISFMITDD